MFSILITGGAGFIGKHLARALLFHEYKVTIVDNLTTGTTLQNLPNGRITFYKEDIQNSETLTDIVKKEAIDTCIHLAGKTSVRDSIHNPMDTARVNIGGTLNVLEACTRNKVKTFVFASSAAVYGEPKLLPLSEDQVPEPLSPYGASKAAGELLALSYKNSEKINNAVALRFFNVYGQGQNPVYAGVITRFAERLAKGLPPIIYGDGKQTRDFISVKDVIRAITLAADSDISGTFNIGTGKPIEIIDLAKLMIDALQLDLNPIYDDALKGDIVHSYADMTKSLRELHFTSTQELASDLKELLSSTYEKNDLSCLNPLQNNSV